MPDHEFPEQELDEWIALSSSVSAADRVRHEPPPGLFDNILRDLDDSSASDETFELDPEPQASAPLVDLSAERQRRAPAAQRQRRRQMFIASLAAAFALVVGFALLGGEETGENIAGAQPEFVAEATNSGLGEPFGGTATATLLSGDVWTLEIEFSDDLPSEEPVELWLIKSDESDMVSLGVVEPGSTQWDWPDGFPPDEYSLVDLSIEPDDGNPEHSGRSILRGKLQSV